MLYLEFYNFTDFIILEHMYVQIQICIPFELVVADKWIVKMLYSNNAWLNMPIKYRKKKEK